MRVLRKWVLLLALGLAPLPAAAQVCGGFIDVFPGNFFCNDVDWIKNRGVTLGCSTPNSYCPDEPVFRSTMAAFMRRLGDALTPFIVRTIDSAFDGTYNPELVGCISAPFAITDVPDYPRQATFTAALMNFGAAQPKSIQAQLVFSTDNGVNWNPTNDGGATQDAVMWQSIGPTVERQSMALVGGPMPLAVGTTYRFAIRATTNAPMVSASGECQLNVRIESRTGSSAPF